VEPLDGDGVLTRDENVNMFRNLGSLAPLNVVIGDGINFISSNAFCKTSSEPLIALSTLSVGDGVSGIEYGAF